MKKRVWFEVEVAGGSKSFGTIKEARAYIEDAKTGFLILHPEDQAWRMSEENREYWKDVAKKMRILQMTQTEQVIK